MVKKIVLLLLTVLLCASLVFTVSAASNQRTSSSSDTGKTLLICAVVGLVIGLITAFALKSQLKTVRMQNQAYNYMIPGSFHLNHSADIFLYSNVTRVAKPQNNSKN